jgi:hypothetical protein
MGGEPGSDLVAVLDRFQAGRDLLAVDWRRHPLGPMADWPTSLSTMVRVLV